MTAGRGRPSLVSEARARSLSPFITIVVSARIGGRGLREYRSPQGWFRLSYPDHWIQEYHEDEAPIFRDPVRGLGVLRVTAIRVEEGKPFDDRLFLETYAKKHGGGEWVQLGDRRAVRAFVPGHRPTERFSTYHWALVEGHSFLVATLTLPKPGASSPAAQEEVGIATRILESVVF